MKKILLIPILFSLSVLPVIVLAQVGYTGATTAPDLDVLTVLDNIINWLFTFLLIFAAIMIIVAAYYFVTASGNPESVSKARHFVIYALIGVVVAFLARGLVVLVGQIVGS